MSQVPLINTYGVFVAIAPYTLPSVNLRCSKIKLLSRYVKDGIDAYSAYYATIGLTHNDYQNDLSIGVSIVRLVDDKNVSYYIPTSYIATIPQSISVPYYRLAISVDIGELSDKVNLDTLLLNIKELTQPYIGTNVIVRLHKISNNVYYSQEESEIKEAQRLLRVDKTPSAYTGLSNLQAENSLLKENISNLEAAIISLTP